MGQVIELFFHALIKSWVLYRVKQEGVSNETNIHWEATS